MKTGDDKQKVLLVAKPAGSTYRIHSGFIYDVKAVDPDQLYADDAVYYVTDSNKTRMTFELSGSLMDPAWNDLGRKLIFAKWAWRWQRVKDLLKRKGDCQ